MPKPFASLRATAQPVFGLAARWRRLVSVVLHMILVALSSYIAFWLRFDGPTPPEQAGLWLTLLPLLLTIRGLTFAPLRLYEGLWRYTSIWDLRNIIAGVLTSSALFFLTVYIGLGITVYPRSIFIIDSIVLICFMGGLRLTRRIVREISAGSGGKTVLVFGAGDAGEMIVRDMRMHSFYGYTPIGFIDDNSGKVGQRIHGVPVLGTRVDLPAIIARYKPHEVLVAIPRAEPSVLRGVVRALDPFKIPITTLPNLREILDGRVEVSQIRQLAVEDLLARAPVGLDARPVRNLIEGRRVLVTGAGGSIGSELCRQIAASQPAKLVLFERHENSLYAIANELRDRESVAETIVQEVIGDVTDRTRVREIFAAYRPEIVFHAAAHKHVPLMELNPCEAVKNNVIGTRIVAEASEEYNVDRFVLISTDKAVNPTSVMGSTKRVSELLLQVLAATARTSFITVRFGNVLGSNGSVVPRFLDQIKAGGPVTVTHPEMARYFMLISEAVNLVLHAATQVESAVYVLNMGEQVKVLDLARDLIRLAGFVPDEDIPIVFTKPRPGEKLFEEIVGPDEVSRPSQTENIFQIQGKPIPEPGRLADQVKELERAALAGDLPMITRTLTAIVPEYGLHASSPGLLLPVGEARKRESLGAQPCPVCGSSDFHRSKAKGMRERIYKYFRQERLFRCANCKWRGWVDQIDSFRASLGAEGGPVPEMDLDSIDFTRSPQPPT